MLINNLIYLQFEAQSKTRPVPPPNPGPRNPHPHQHPHPPRMMMGPPQGMRPRMPPPGMPPPGPGQRMPGPPMGHAGPQGHGHPPGPPSQGHPPPGFQHGNWNGPRANGMHLLLFAHIVFLELGEEGIVRLDSFIICLFYYWTIIDLFIHLLIFNFHES